MRYLTYLLQTKQNQSIIKKEKTTLKIIETYQKRSVDDAF